MYPFIYSVEEVEYDDEGDGLSLGYTEQQEFVDDYGAYMEIIYMISNGDLLKFDDIVKMDAHKFLFLGQYLIRKRMIENKPNKKEL